MRLRLLSESPSAYLLRAASQATADRQRDIDTINDALTRLGRSGESAREAGVGLGWTADRLVAVLAALEELTESRPPYDIAWWPRDDFDPCVPTVALTSPPCGVASEMVVKFVPDMGVAALQRDEFVALFESVAAIDTSSVDGVSSGATPTHAVTLVEWWRSGHGAPSLREFLAPYAIGEAVIAEGAPCVEPTDRYEWYEVHAVEGEQFRFGRHSSLPGAVRDAVARVREGVRSQLIGFRGSGVGKTLSFFSMNTDDSRAVEAVLERVVEEAVEMPRVGHIIEGENDFEVVVIEAGMSMNRNFYPASLLRKKFVDVFEGAPVRVIGWDPQRYTGDMLPDSANHMPFEVSKNLPAGTILNQVGQLVDLRFEPTGGNAPDPTEARVLAKRFGMTPEEVMSGAEGRIVGRLNLDSDARSQVLGTKLRDASQRGTLQRFGLSIDVEEAPYVSVWETWMSSPINWRTDVNGSKGVYLDFVNRPSAGGRVLKYSDDTDHS